jgi:hypothetical protein
MPKWFLRSIEISGGFLPGLAIQFPRGLTCIIGPRGSGKSTLAEALRYGIGGINRASNPALVQAMRADAAVRDFAMLEVTTLLHRRADINASVTRLCDTLYTNSNSDAPVPGDLADWPDIEGNTFQLIREIRKQALAFSDLPNYALLVFDCAMMQLGGLIVQSRGNKIASPKDAVAVADFAARWLSLVAPDIATSSCSSSVADAD